jgi:hypothetical protein
VELVVCVFGSLIPDLVMGFDGGTREWNSDQEHVSLEFGRVRHSRAGSSPMSHDHDDIRDSRKRDQPAGVNVPPWLATESGLADITMSLRHGVGACAVRQWMEPLLSTASKTAGGIEFKQTGSLYRQHGFPRGSQAPSSQGDI